MRRLFLLILLVILLVAFGSGCNKGVFFVDFTETDNLPEWYSDGGFDLSDDGLNLAYNAYLSTPYMFNDDFTVTVVFQALAPTTEQRVFYHVILSDDKQPDPVNNITTSFYIYATDNANYRISDEGSGGEDEIEYGSAMPGLLVPAINTLVIEKENDVVTVTLNGALLGSFAIVKCQTEYFCVSFLSEYGTIGTDVIVRSLKVEYEGDKIPTP